MSKPLEDRRRDNLLSLADVRRRTSLSTTTIYRRQGVDFPPKRQIGPGRYAWYESDVDAFVADPMAYRP